MATKLTAKDLDKMAGFSEYEPPTSPIQRPKVVAEFETQKEAADFLKDMSKIGFHGASKGTSDELVGLLKTGSISSPEYVTERNKVRNEISRIREENPMAAPITEGMGSIASDLAIPVMKGAPALKSILSAGLEGAGEASAMEDIPSEAAKSALIQGTVETASKLAKKVIADDPTKILTRSMGARSSQFNQPQGRQIKDAVQRLNSVGFFKQGEVSVDPANQKFFRSGKTLTEFIKPQNLDTLYERATKAISTLKDANNTLIAGKKIPEKDLIKVLQDGIQEMSFDPSGFNVSARLDLATETAQTVIDDLIQKGKLIPGKALNASDIEEAKKALDLHVGSSGFKKRAEELALNPESLVLFRRKLDELVDKVGGPAYKKNNDLMSDLISVQETINNKLKSDYTDSGSKLVDNRSILTKLLEAASPTPVDIVRSDLASIAERPVAQEVGKVLKRTPVESLKPEEKFPVQEQDQGYNFDTVKPAFPPLAPRRDTMISPKEIIQYRIPRSTQGILENKDKVIAKLVQNGVPNEMVDTIVQALNSDHDAVANIAPLISTQFPTLFERTKYKVFDGQFIDPNDKAKAADDISKRDDINSIEKARMISMINKTGKVPEGLV